MAQRVAGRWGCRWLKGFRSVLLIAMSLLVLGAGGSLLAADAVATNAPVSDKPIVALTYQETGYDLINRSVPITVRSVPFNKEPSAASGKILRGVLSFGGSASNSIPFIWQRDTGKLLLDLNRNEDFTDDPAGTFSARVLKQVYSQTTFTNVHLPFNTVQGESQVLVDINLWDYGSRPSCSVSVRSFWQGKLALPGQDWQVGILPRFLGQIGSQAVSLENSQLLLRPWARRNQAFNALNGSLDVISFTRKLFFGGRAYQVDWLTRSNNNEMLPALQFTEQTVALGELKITGKYIQRLVLPSRSYLVILDQPADTVKIPTGSYDGIPNVWLEQGGTQAYSTGNQWPSAGKLAVSEKTPAILSVGGPLTNTVTASRHGQDLSLNYRLIGAGGETYQLANEDRSHPPEFAIYKDDKKIASGNFEYG